MNSIARDSRGRWLPGVVPNPGGRPAVTREVRDLARSYGPEAIAKLHELMRNGKSEQVQLAAAEELLNRGYGRPMQQLHIEHEENASPFSHLSPDEKRRAAALIMQTLASDQAKIIDASVHETEEQSPDNAAKTKD
jgi:hypothetical protein